MSVKVKVSLLLRNSTDSQEEVEVTGQSPMECLHNLEERFPDTRRLLYDEQGELRPQVWFFANGERIYDDDLTNPLQDGDELFIMLAIGGG